MPIDNPKDRAKLQKFQTMVTNFNANKKKFEAARDQVNRFRKPPAAKPSQPKTIVKKVVAPKPVEVILPPPTPPKAPSPVKNTIRIFGKEYEPAAVWTLGTLGTLAALYGGYKLLSR